MKVVLLILSIVLVAMAPVMTTRIKRSNDIEATAVWHWAQNHLDAYFSDSDQAQTAMIGQTEVDAMEPMARLIINTNDNRPNHILFKKDNGVLGKLTFQNNSLVLGTGSVEGFYNMAIGNAALYSNTTGSYNTASGHQALYNNTSGHNNTANRL